MKKPVVIAAAVLLALLTAAGILLVTQKKDSSQKPETPQPNVREMVDNTTTITSDPVEESYLEKIAELQTLVEKLEREKGQAEFDRAALQAEQDKLKKQLADLREQNQYLRNRNDTLDDHGTRFDGIIAAKDAEIATRDGELASGRTALVARGEEIARLCDRIAHLEAERDRIYSAYQDAQHDIYEYREMLRRRESALTSAETAGTLHVNREGKLVNTFNILPPGQSRNILGIRFGDRDVDLEGSIALMPHWFLLATLGIDQTHDDFVKKEFPGYDSDNAFFYDILLGTGVNWRFNKIQSQPNFYINTALGPAWFLYKQDGETDLKSYLLWRSSVGFDLTLHKHLQFTGDVGVDWVQSAGFSARFSLGVIWSFSHDWAIMGGK